MGRGKRLTGDAPTKHPIDRSYRSLRHSRSNSATQRGQDWDGVQANPERTPQMQDNIEVIEMSDYILDWVAEKVQEGNARYLGKVEAEFNGKTVRTIKPIADRGMVIEPGTVGRVTLVSKVVQYPPKVWVLLSGEDRGRMVLVKCSDSDIEVVE